MDRILLSSLLRGCACLMQDFFEAGILPADTDFRMMSAKYLGNLPGVDIAFLLDSGAYHSTRDVPERIRPGTLQVSICSRIDFTLVEHA